MATFLIIGSLMVWLRDHYALQADGRSWAVMLWAVGFAMGLTVLVPRLLFRAVPNGALSLAAFVPALVMAFGNLWLTAGSVQMTMTPAVVYAAALLLGTAAGVAVVALLAAR